MHFPQKNLVLLYIMGALDSLILYDATYCARALWRGVYSDSAGTTISKATHDDLINEVSRGICSFGAPMAPVRQDLTSQGLLPVVHSLWGLRFFLDSAILAWFEWQWAQLQSSRCRLSQVKSNFSTGLYGKAIFLKSTRGQQKACALRQSAHSGIVCRHEPEIFPG
jgi:hypothetical protein